MTIEKTMHAKLVDSGLWDEEADAVMVAAKERPMLATMKDRWHEDNTAYPTGLLATVWMSVKKVAADWLAKNKPEHWARGMFDPPLVEKIESEVAL